jgi:hypothetical protein
VSNNHTLSFGVFNSACHVERQGEEVTVGAGEQSQEQNDLLQSEQSAHNNVNVVENSNVN